MATTVYRGSHRSWVPILGMVVALAVLQTYGYQTGLNNTVLHGVGGLILVLGIYAAMRVV
jgi:hypothetical protein